MENSVQYRIGRLCSGLLWTDRACGPEVAAGVGSLLVWGGAPVQVTVGPAVWGVRLGQCSSCVSSLGRGQDETKELLTGLDGVASPKQALGRTPCFTCSHWLNLPLPARSADTCRLMIGPPQGEKPEGTRSYAVCVSEGQVGGEDRIDHRGVLVWRSATMT